MPDEIKKHKFRSDVNIEIEVVSLEALVKAKKDYLINPHRTDFYHIFLFENCSPTHFVEFEAIKIKPYSLLFIDKDRVHQFDLSLNYVGRVLVFTEDFFCTTENDTKFLRSSILFNEHSNHPFLNLDKKKFLKYISICDNISEELNLPQDNSKYILLKNLLQNFLLLANREKRKQGFIEKKKGVELDYTLVFQDLLEKNYTVIKAVNDYAKLICISEKRLKSATIKILGKPPKEIINGRILLEAKRLLVHTNLFIKEIGQQLGFEDPAYFVRYFKKSTKATPAEFRENFLKK